MIKISARLNTSCLCQRAQRRRVFLTHYRSAVLPEDPAVAVVGIGHVGTATASLFPTATLYDPFLGPSTRTTGTP